MEQELQIIWEPTPKRLELRLESHENVNTGGASSLSKFCALIENTTSDITYIGYTSWKWQMLEGVT